MFQAKIINAQQLGQQAELYMVGNTVLVQVPGIVVMVLRYLVAGIDEGDSVRYSLAADIKNQFIR